MSTAGMIKGLTEREEGVRKRHSSSFSSRCFFHSPYFSVSLSPSGTLILFLFLSPLSLLLSLFLSIPLSISLFLSVFSLSLSRLLSPRGKRRTVGTEKEIETEKEDRRGASSSTSFFYSLLEHIETVYLGRSPMCQRELRDRSNAPGREPNAE